MPWDWLLVAIMWDVVFGLAWAFAYSLEINLPRGRFETVLYWIVGYLLFLVIPVALVVTHWR